MRHFSEHLTQKTHDDFVPLMTGNYREFTSESMLDTLLSNQMAVACLNTRPKIMHIFFGLSVCNIHSKVNVVARAEKRAAIYRPYGHVKEHNRPNRTSINSTKNNNNTDTHTHWAKEWNFENNKRAIISVYVCLLLTTEHIVHHLIIVFMMSAVWAFNNENVSKCVLRVSFSVTMAVFCYYFFTIISIALYGSTVNLSSKDSQWK